MELSKIIKTINCFYTLSNGQIYGSILDSENLNGQQSPLLAKLNCTVGKNVLS